jgi:hypothetical protein
MLKFDLNLAPLFAVAVANFLLSWLWYSPLLFAKPWAKALGLDIEKGMTEEDKKRMPMLFASGIFSSFALSFALQVLIYSLGASTLGQGALIGALAWFGFALTGSLGTLWEGRKPTVLLVNNGLFFVSYAVFGGIIAVWH